MVTQFPDIKKLQRLVDEGNWEFDIGNGKFEMSIKQSVVGSQIYKSSSQGDREVNLRVITVQTIFKIMKLFEVMKGENTNREEKRSQN